MSTVLADTLRFSTVLIENQWHLSGTGFLVSKIIDSEKGKIFLVTNKHVINKNRELRETAALITLNFNRKTDDGEFIRFQIPFPLVQGGMKTWREHTDPDVDVLAIDVSGLLAQLVEKGMIYAKWADYDLIISPQKIREENITCGEDVIVIGYPLGISSFAVRHKNNNLPLFRSGIISTTIGEELEDDVNEGGTSRKRRLRGFLVDGGIIPGSSGSPVVFKLNFSRFAGGTLNLGESLPPYILGIVAETRYSPIDSQGASISYADLGLVFDASTIRETIELFF